MRISIIIYGVSLGLHAALAASVVSLKPAVKKRPPTAIAIREVKRKPATPPPEPPPPEAPKAEPPPRKAPPVARAATPPPAAAPAAAPVAAVPDFGLALGGGVGAGLAVPPPREGTTHEPTQAKPKVLEAAPAQGGCNEDPVKPKPVNIVQPSYASEEARAAGIEGKVRIEITVGVDGTVKNAKLISGLGYGLDEAALEAARASTFEPGTRCGQPSETTFTMGIRFSL
ncbi:MAG: TonB family protein [Deltaproteobacteria bacterium]|nr:TonB family protein [Deltaproteobacteria bacterium]